MEGYTPAGAVSDDESSVFDPTATDTIRLAASHSAAYADFKTSAVDAESDTITAVGHGFVDGQEVLYVTDSAVLGGTSSEGRYYVIVVDEDSFKLAATREDAIEGTAIDLDTTPASVDYERNTIRIPDHGYTTGDEVVYKAGGGDGPSPIDGLVDGETYVVLVVDADTIQLARASPVDLHLGDAKETSNHGFLRPASAKFVLNAVDEDGDAIWLPGHSFATGDTVTYTHESAFGAIEGIEKGTQYLVEVDGDWIKLRSVGESLDAPAIELRQGHALGYHEFSTGDEKRYALELGRVDADSDTVYRENHGLGGAMWGAGVYLRTSTHGIPSSVPAISTISRCWTKTRSCSGIRRPGRR